MSLRADVTPRVLRIGCTSTAFPCDPSSVHNPANINEAILSSSANEEKRERREVGGNSKLMVFDVLHPDFSTGCERIATSAQPLGLMRTLDVNNIHQR